MTNISKTTRGIFSLYFLGGLVLASFVWAVLHHKVHSPHATALEPNAADSKPNAAQPDTTTQENKPKHAGKKPMPTNRLIRETSPYLRMHAHNPVEWYPWGDEAIALAKKENKPIFLSIGYSSCYWCHVMERESFMDEEIAKFMNDHFICIKVDREERPDLDDIYMTSVQMMTGRGGWPMSVFLTPEGKPFFGGTYFPPRRSAKHPRPGFLELMGRINTLWGTKELEVKQAADKLTDAIREQLSKPPTGTPPKLDGQIASKALAALNSEFDHAVGGFGFTPQNPRIPKFPEPAKLRFVLHVLSDSDSSTQEKTVAKTILETTLDHMARGGMYDHLGGGFHRYSTDRFWWVPHFEKMLYDNGQLASLYAGMYSETKNPQDAKIARGICDFVLRELTSPDGGFYSALDAETDGEEGLYYVWKQEELNRLLTAEERAFLANSYLWTAGALRQALPLGDAEKSGLTRFFPTGEEAIFEGKHVLMLGRSIEKIAKAKNVSPEKLEAAWEPIRKKLFEARSKRERPLTDTKILTGWNGLMIEGMADTGAALNKPKYTTAAANAADFILSSLRTKDGRLKRTFGEGHAKLNGYLDDYSFLIAGLIALHEATGEEKWLTAAKELTDKQIELFWDKKSGGFFFHFARPRTAYRKG